MNLTQLIADEDAVSPVIGVILMVAITVILAAVIGTFVLGLGENVQDSAPQANFQFEYSTNADGTHDGDTTSGDEDEVTITHTGGEDVESSNIEVTQSGGAGSFAADTGFATGALSTGSSGVWHGTQAGETIRVIWTSPSGGTSNTIGQSTVPS